MATVQRHLDGANGEINCALDDEFDDEFDGEFDDDEYDGEFDDELGGDGDMKHHL